MVQFGQEHPFRTDMDQCTVPYSMANVAVPYRFRSHAGTVLPWYNVGTLFHTDNCWPPVHFRPRREGGTYRFRPLPLVWTDTLVMTLSLVMTNYCSPCTSVRCTLPETVHPSYVMPYWAGLTLFGSIPSILHTVEQATGFRSSAFAPLAHMVSDGVGHPAV